MGWVLNQRQFKRKGHLSPERIHRLEVLGFTWVPKNAQWEEMYTRLKAYKKLYGRCNVPRRWKQDQRLSFWVSTQRQFKRKGRLSRERIRLLNALRFEWDQAKEVGGDKRQTS